MTKRNVTTVLWFLAVWTAGDMLTVFAGWPSLSGPALGLLVAAVIWWDPAGVLWARRVDKARIRRRLADLPRAADTPTETELRSEVDAVRG
jgi:hypothetical protein